MFNSELDQQRLECACIALYQSLKELLQEQKISAMEFLSAVGQLPITPADFNKHR